MATVIRMPSVMANATEAAIQAWLVEEGAEIEVGTPLAEIETEKAVIDYASEEAGTVGRLLAAPGANVDVGAPIAVILVGGEGADAIGAALAEAGVTADPTVPEYDADTARLPAAGTPGETSPAPDPVVGPAPGSPTGDRLFASPIVRRLAKEHGVPLDSLTGTGPGGRVVRADLDRALKATRPAAAATPAQQTRPAPAPATATATATANGAQFTDVPLSGMRRAIARRLSESKSTVPHFYLAADVRVDRLLQQRHEINGSAPRRVSVNDLVVKAVAGALTEVPGANAIWLGDSIRRFDGVDIAVAVAVDDGLLTPVVRGAHALPLVDLSARIADLAALARSGRLKQAELEGGAFAVSNLGMYGVDSFSAILNPPQAGILAVAAAKPRPVVENGALTVGTVMTVTLSADHRVVDGAVAAEWMAAFVRRIEQPLSLLL